jgi:hypothetical protein
MLGQIVNSSLLDILICETFPIVRPGLIKFIWKKYFTKKTRKWYPMGRIDLSTKTQCQVKYTFPSEVYLWSIHPQISIQLKNNALKTTCNFP